MSRLTILSRTEQRGSVFPVILLLIPFFLSSIVMSATASEQSVCRAKNRSSAPLYVLVTAINSQTGEQTLRAVESTRLHRALALEHGFQDFQALSELIDQQPDLVFEFSNNDALLRLLSPHAELYMERLDEARHALLELDNDQILSGFSHAPLYGKLHQLYSTESSKQDGSYLARMRPVAHALLERGFFPTRSDPFAISLTDKRCR